MPAGTLRPERNEEKIEPLAITHVEVIQLPARDVARATRFYVDGLGLGPGGATGNGEGSSALFHFAQGGPGLQLQAPPSPFGAPDSPIVAMEVERGTDLEKLLRAIEATGGRVTYRNVRTPEWLIIGISDPEGNALELLIRY